MSLTLEINFFTAGYAGILSRIREQILPEHLPMTVSLSLIGTAWTIL